jgi:hypothetical protein
MKPGAGVLLTAWTMLLLAVVLLLAVMRRARRSGSSMARGQGRDDAADDGCN